MNILRGSFAPSGSIFSPEIAGEFLHCAENPQEAIFQIRYKEKKTKAGEFSMWKKPLFLTRPIHLVLCGDKAPPPSMVA